MYTELEVEKLVLRIGLKLQDTITAKIVIQNNILANVTMEERLALANDKVSNFLVERVITEASKYANVVGRNEDNLVCIAMAAGTILKELDNGNTSFVSNSYLTKIMNRL